MTYGDEHGKTTFLRPDGSREEVTIGEKRFFELADETFYQWNAPLHKDNEKFAKIFPYHDYSGKKVLEIGCGMGCMIMNWAQHGANVTAVDLNPVAIEYTKKRFSTYNLNGDIQEADAENLPFSDNTFDYIYSWGVLHHTPGTEKAINEIYRVLKPGGSCGVMLYHRNSFLYRFLIQWMQGYINFENTFLSSLQLASRYGDGDRAEGNPHTWPITQKEGHQLFKQFKDVDIKVFGTDVSNVLKTLLPWPLSKFPLPLLKSLARRWGWSLWITANKK